MKIVAYYRVGPKSPGGTWLDLEEQQAAVAAYAKQNRGKIIADYREIETGAGEDRPKLMAAISHAKNVKATLVIAKIDRLARKHSFVTALMDSNIDFIACDNPHANRLTVHILSAVAEDESRRISQRTKDSLAAAKAKGTQLGSARPGHWKGRERGFKQAAKASGEMRTKRAAQAYQFLEKPILEKLKAGWGYQPIADWLTTQGHLTTAGMPFNATSVWRIMQRSAPSKVEGHEATLNYNRPQTFIAKQLAAGLSFAKIAKSLKASGYGFPDGTAFTASDVEALVCTIGKVRAGEPRNKVTA